MKLELIKHYLKGLLQPKKLKDGPERALSGFLKAVNNVLSHSEVCGQHCTFEIEGTFNL